MKITIDLPDRILLGDTHISPAQRGCCCRQHRLFCADKSESQSGRCGRLSRGFQLYRSFFQSWVLKRRPEPVWFFGEVPALPMCGCCFIALVFFCSSQHLMKAFDIEEVDGLNVVLEIEFGPLERLGYLQIHSSGYIKYTPIVFRHPVSQGFDGLDYLLRKQNEEFLRLGVSKLKGAGVPLFGFDPKSSASANAGPVDEIFNWLMANGREHDVTEPKVFISPSEFEALVDDLKQKYGYMFN